MRTFARMVGTAAVALALVAGSTAGSSAGAIQTPTAAPVAARPAAPAIVVPAATVSPAAASAASAVKRGPSRILLTPGRSSATTQVITWTMGKRTGGMRLQYRVAGSSAITSVAAKRRAPIAKKYSGSRAPRYLVSLTRLKPGTTYSYRIVTKRGTTPWYSFRTEDPRDTSTTLIGLGDMQRAYRGVPRRTVQAALKAAPDAVAVLQAGDAVNNPTKDAQWAGLFSAIGTSGRTRDWVVSIGNHERCLLIRCASGNAQAFRNYFAYTSNGFPGQQSTWFYVDYPGVRVIALDAFAGSMETTQAAFLDRALATNTRPFSILVMHAPVYPSVLGREPLVPAPIQRIITKHDVDLVLTGHDHTYARGHRTPNSTVYVTSVSGPKYYTATDAGWRAGKAQRLVWAQATSTYQVVTVSGRTLTYRAVVTHRGAGSTSRIAPGGVLDRLVIDKTRPGVKIVR